MIERSFVSRQTYLNTQGRSSLNHTYEAGAKAQGNSLKKKKQHKKVLLIKRGKKYRIHKLTKNKYKLVCTHANLQKDEAIQLSYFPVKC